MTLCPTCGRRASERLGYQQLVGEDTGLILGCKLFECHDPIHDLADAAPEMLAALEECQVDGLEMGPNGIYSVRCKWCGGIWYQSEEPKHKTGCVQLSIDAAIEAAGGER